jgi:ribosomal protein S18 acetylase RimI-like enzyme
MLVEGSLVEIHGHGVAPPWPCEDAAVHQLDNAVWHALTGPHANVAERVGSAARYDPGISPFAAIPDTPGEDAWNDLASLVGPGATALLFRVEVPPAPQGWHEVARLPGVQMVAVDAERGVAAEIERLGDRDANEMLALAEATRPGPFTTRTRELGSYVGIRDGGALVAMAGERFHIPGHTEISAVCTAPSHRRRGLAAILVRAVVHEIVERGEVPFLHAVSDNFDAIRLYEQLGFELRSPVEVVTLRAPSVEAT